MQIAIAGRIYSDNLGDSAIMESSRFMAQSIPGATSVIDVDLAGRSSRPEMPKTTDQQSAAKKIHGFAYSRSVQYGEFFNRSLFAIHLKNLQRTWSEALSDSSVLVIGGGQLVQHSRLLFPLRIQELSRMAAERRIPIVLAGVGVGSFWNPSMRKLFVSCLSLPNVKAIACRDEASAKMLSRQIPAVAKKVSTIPDLAIAVPEFVEVSPTVVKEFGERGAGIAPISPNALRRIGVTGPLARDGDATRFWTEAFLAAEDAFGEALLFTTGTKEDAYFTAEVASQLKGRGPRVFLPTCFEDLYSVIASRQAVIGGRLHCSILAWTAQRPLRGLIWDPKVEGFAQMVGSTASFFRTDADPVEVVEAVSREVLAGPASSERDANVERLTTAYQRLVCSAIQ